MLIHHYEIDGSTLFFERTHLQNFGGFDIEYRMLEDFPITLKYLTNGYRIKIIHEPLVTWRVYDDSVSHSSSNAHSIMCQDFRNALRHYTLRYSWRYGLLFHQYNYWLMYWLEEHSDKNYYFKVLGYILRCFDLIHFYRRIVPIKESLPYLKLESDTTK